MLRLLIIFTKVGLNKLFLVIGIIGIFKNAKIIFVKFDVL